MAGLTWPRAKASAKALKLSTPELIWICVHGGLRGRRNKESPVPFFFNTKASLKPQEMIKNTKIQKSLTTPPSVLNLTVFIVEDDLCVCRPDLSGSTVLNQIGSFWDLFFLPGASGANFQEGLDQIVAGMWIIIQRTYLTGRALKKNKLPRECWNLCLLLIKYRSCLLSISNLLTSCFINHKKGPCEEKITLLHIQSNRFLPLISMLSFILGLIKCVLHTTVQQSRILAAGSLTASVFCFVFFCFFSISHEKDPRSASYPLAVFYFFEAIIPVASWWLRFIDWMSVWLAEKLHVL